MGEPAGIGPDISLKAWMLARTNDLPPFFVIGAPAVLADRAGQMGIDIAIAEISNPGDTQRCFDSAMPVLPLDCKTVTAGQPNLETATTVIAAIETAAALIHGGEANAMVTNPIAKSVLTQAGFPHPGHTEFLATLSKNRHTLLQNPSEPQRAVMMLSSDVLNVVPITIHIPYRDVPSTLTSELIVETAKIVAKDLSEKFAVTHPRLAISGLNPHAGEAATMGLEDRDIIAPAIAQLQAVGINATGPHPADSMFHETARADYDVALCMYHDQALIPIKTLAFDRAVNVTLGLDFIRTSPDHGTAFDIAGSGLANPSSLFQAIKLADRMSQTRSTTEVADHGL